MAFASFPLFRITIDPTTGKKGCACGDPLCPNVGKHPATAWSQLGTGERRHRDGEPYGIATGSRSGFFVVDTDIKPDLEVDGEARLLTLGELPETLTVRTGSGGLHRYFINPTDFTVRNSSGKLGQSPFEAAAKKSSGIDVRGEGGYVVGPGSPHKSGTTYEVAVHHDIVEAPAWLLSYLRGEDIARGAKTQMGPGQIARGPEHDDYEARVATAVAYLQKDAPVPAESAQGGTTFFKVCLRLVRTYELPLPVCAELVETHYNPRLEAVGAKPWTGRRLEGKLSSAERQGESPTGTELARFEKAAAKEPPPRALDRLVPVAADAPPVQGPRVKVTVIGAMYGGKMAKASDQDLIYSLMHDESWVGVWRYNEFTRKVHAVHAPVHLIAEEEGGVHDTDATRVKAWFETQRGVLASMEQIYRAVPAVAEERRYHPVRDYLEALPAHRGASLFPGLAARLFGNENPISDVFLRKWMIAGVRRVLTPGCKADDMLILQGGQGLGKSTFFKIMSGGAEWFLEGVKDVTSSDTLDALNGKWIIEFDELQALIRTDAATFKGFVTRTHETYRKKYAREPRAVARQCIFGGTTNDDDFLRDPTGNRRYWPVRVTKLLDRDYLVAMRDALWAEAYASALQPAHDGPGGVAHWLTPEEFQEAELVREPFIQGDPWMEEIGKYLAGKPAVTLADVYKTIVTQGASIEKLDYKVQNRITKCLKAHGCAIHNLRDPLTGRQGKKWVVPDFLAKLTANPFAH